MTWHTSQGTADLKSTFGASRHDLNVSTYQMCVLLLFNAADTLSYADIQDATQVRRITKKNTTRYYIYIYMLEV